MTNPEKKIEDHPLIVMNQDGEVNLTATIKAAKKDVLTSLLERGPKPRSMYITEYRISKEWRNLISLMISECK